MPRCNGNSDKILKHIIDLFTTYWLLIFRTRRFILESRRTSLNAWNARPLSLKPPAGLEYGDIRCCIILVSISRRVDIILSRYPDISILAENFGRPKPRISSSFCSFLYGFPPLLLPCSLADRIPSLIH